jgi:hypothetical protein
MDFHGSVVADEAEPAEFVHEEADARSRCPDHFCEHLLGHFSKVRFWLAVLAVVGQQQQRASKALFARIEQLIDEILFRAHRARQEVSDELFGKGGFFVKRKNHEPLLDAHDLAVDHRGRGRISLQLAGQTPFAKEFVPPQNGDHGFLTVLGANGDLHLALLYVEHGVGRIALDKDRMVFRKCEDRPAAARSRQKTGQIECCRSLRHDIWTSFIYGALTEWASRSNSEIFVVNTAQGQRRDPFVEYRLLSAGELVKSDHP